MRRMAIAGKSLTIGQIIWLAFWLVLVFYSATALFDAQARKNGMYSEGEQEERMLFDTGDSTDVVVNPRAFAGGQR